MMFIFLYSKDPEVTRTYIVYHFAIYKFTISVYSFYISLKPNFQDVSHEAHINLFPNNDLSLSISTGIYEP